MAEIIIRVSTDGKVNVKVEGWMGESCSLKSQPYREALGKTIEDLPTVEAFQTITELEPLESVQ